MKKLAAILSTLLLSATSYAAGNAPQFVGGQEALDTYIATNLKYPATARDNGIEGVVAVVFVVKTDGSIGNIKIKRMVDPDLENEAIRLVKNMPAWTPATDGTTAIEAPAEVSITFTLE